MAKILYKNDNKLYGLSKVIKQAYKHYPEHYKYNDKVSNTTNKRKLEISTGLPPAKRRVDEENTQRLTKLLKKKWNQQEEALNNDTKEKLQDPFTLDGQKNENPLINQLLAKTIVVDQPDSNNNSLVLKRDISNFNKDKEQEPINDANNALNIVSNKLIIPIQKQIEKSTIHNFLRELIGVNILNEKVLADITFHVEGNHIQIVGRPKVQDSTKQMRHVTPFHLISTLIKHQVKAAVSPIDLLDLLTKSMLAFLHKDGLCFKESELQTSAYAQIEPKIRPHIKKKMHIGAEILNFVDKKYSPNIFDSPTKEKKAMAEYKINNPILVQKAMNNLKVAIYDDNTATMVSECLARIIFILFNQKPHTSFPTEGNTLNYEIRLYKDKDKAETHSKAQGAYKIKSAGEISQLIKDGKLDSINKCIRIVKCEGPDVKKVVEALGILGNIIEYYNIKQNYSVLISSYNTKYNKSIKLANVDPDLTPYHKPLTKEGNKLSDQLPPHVAKQLFLAFDFTALEKEVLVPKAKGKIKLYPSAGGETMANYTIIEGSEYREEKRNSGLKNYNSKIVFRTEEVDYDLLAELIVKHVYIATMPFAPFHNGFTWIKDNFISSVLNSFVQLVKYDYEIKNKDTTLEGKVTELYNNIQSASSTVYDNQNVKITLLGNTAYNEFDIDNMTPDNIN